MISIREVARLAEVSPATVSRVLNGTARVNEEKARRVCQVVEETGFVPNEVARSLFKRSSKLIGLIVPNIENPFFSQLAKHMENEAYQRGYRIVLCNTNNVRNKESDSIQMLRRMNADGIIIMTSDEELQLEVEKSEMPVVIMDRQITEVKDAYYIRADHYTGGKIATEHLVACGCKNIVNVKGPQIYSSGRARFHGYVDVVENMGLKQQCVECDYSFQAGLKTAEEILEQYPAVDGIIACNDIVALSIMKVFGQRGIAIPGQVQIIGFDNIEMSSMVAPELTTIMQPFEEMGKKAVDLVISEAEGNGVEKDEYTFPVQLVVRNTTIQA